MDQENRLVPPVKKGDVLKLGVVSIGSNGDFMFKVKKNPKDKKSYCLFLKNPKNKSVVIGQQIKIKVVKIFPKVGYVELAE